MSYIAGGKKCRYLATEKEGREEKEAGQEGASQTTARCREPGTSSEGGEPALHCKSSFVREIYSEGCMVCVRGSKRS